MRRPGTARGARADTVAEGDAAAVGLRADSVARLAADAVTMAVGVVGSIVVARALGPAGKGTYSTLSFLVEVGAGIATLGLGDAVVVFVTRRGLAAGDVVPSTVGVGLATSAAGAAVFVALAALLVDAPLSAALAGAATVVAIGIASVVAGVLVLHHRLRRAAFASASIPLLTTVALLVLVGAGGGGLTASMLAGTAGSVVGLVVYVRGVHGLGVSLRPRRTAVSVRDTLRFGAVTQSATILHGLAARIDLLAVYWLLGDTAAGQYSIALTVAVLGAVVPRSVAYAAFPHLSARTVEEGQALLARSTRAGAAWAVVVAATIVVTAPTVIPGVFGADYADAVGPSRIAVLGGVLAGVQWSVARARVAQGRPGDMALSFGASTLAMLTLDLVLVPHLELTGAAIAAVVGPAVGCAVSFAPRRGLPGVRLRDVVPRPRDLAVVRRSLRGRSGG